MTLFNISYNSVGSCVTVTTLVKQVHNGAVNIKLTQGKSNFSHNLNMNWLRNKK